MDLQDKITLLRGLLGTVFGAISYFTVTLSVVLSLIVPLIGYAVSVVLVKVLGGEKKWDLYLRGVYVYFLTWLLIVIVAYNLSL